MIDVTCPLCGEVYHADPAHVGKRIKCGRCSSLVPILGTEGTIVERTPGFPWVRESPPHVGHREARPSRFRFSFGLGITAVVAVTAIGLAGWWYSTYSDADADPVPSTRTGELQTSSQVDKATPEPTATPDGFIVVDEEPRGTGGNARPCAEQEPSKHRSMPNGSRIITDSPTSGYGVLEVENGTSDDAVLSLYDSAADETIREVYIQAKHSVWMKGIPEGTYQLAYTAGLDWDGGEDVFRCDPDYAQFDRDFVFTEETNREGVQYNSITVTLHPVVGGNIRTKRISREEFLRGNHRTAALSR